VTFVIGTPRIVPRGLVARGVSYTIVGWIEMLLGPSPIDADSVTVVAAPLDERSALLLWYLTPSPEVDRRIATYGWEVVVVRKAVATP
jgi:hypothetical protein